MSHSFCRLNSSVRSLRLGSSSVSGHARRFSQVALKQNPASDSSYSRQPPRERQRDEDSETTRSAPLGTRRVRSAFGKDRQVPRVTRTDYSAMREPSPEFAEHLNGLFPELQFPKELARRILTHSSHPAAIYGHNAALSFLGRRVLSTYLSLLLSSSPNLKPTDDVEEVVSSVLNTYDLGEHIGSGWGLGRAMRWTPAVSATTLQKVGAQPSVLKGAGLYKVQGEAVAAVMGGVYEQFGASVAHRLFHTRILPRLIADRPGIRLPAAFHQDVRVVSNRMGGSKGSLLKKQDEPELKSPFKKPTPAPMPGQAKAEKKREQEKTRQVESESSAEEKSGESIA
ncbi:hypothetical protein VKT23_007264 [Stygiomarasmius scandens]|uniref:RNase III domain-containing protein n=1 Tax=Marasmiellus scandens TaxID=2682957 RepID=A0ABR1JPS1_9AGAR